MQKLFKRVVTMLLSVAMVFGLSGMTAFAAETDNEAAQDVSAEPEVLSEDEYGTAAIADANSYDAKYDWYINGSSPYQISSPEELAGLSDIVNGTADGISQDSFVGKTVELTQSIDMNADGAVEWSYSTYEAGGTGGVNSYTAVATEVTVAADAKAFTPIGNMTFTADGTVSKGNAFLGTFDGGGNTIRNLYVTGAKGDYLGLFGAVGGTDPESGECYGTVENFTLTGVIYHTATVNPSRGTDDELADFVGAACGKLNAGGTIQGVISEMDVEAPNAFNVGGIVGCAGTPNAMGYSSNPSRDNTHVLCCANKGEATFGYNYVGGVVGYNAATVKYSYNNSWVFNHNSGTKGSYGGVIGMNSTGNAEETVAAYCYNTGTISNNGRPDYGATSRYFGGIAGWAHAGTGRCEIYNCYNRGNIPEGYAGGSDKSGFASITAGLEAGLPEVTNRNNYSLDSDEIHNDAGTTLQMTGIKVSEEDFKLSSYEVGDILTNLGHYFVPDGTGKINDGYPVLWWEAGASLPTISGLSITEAPDKTVYKEGETFDPTGMEVIAEYENGVQELVIPKEVIYNEEAYELDDGYTYDHKELESGMSSVTITYTNGEGDTVTTEQPIYMEGDATPSELLITPPNKTEYVAGQTFDPAGMTFTVVFSDGSEASVDVSAVQIPTEPLELGQTSVTISYTLGLTTVSAEQEITVDDPAKVSKDALQAEYDEDISLNEEDYTAASWETFATALENAKTVLDEALVTQGEVDDALAALQSAKAGLEEAIYGDLIISKDGEIVATVTGEQYKELQAAAPEQTFKMYRGDTGTYTEVTAHFVLVSDLLGANQPDEGCGVDFDGSRPWQDMDNLYMYYKTDTGTYSQAVDGTSGYAGWIDGIGNIILGHEYVDGVCVICGETEPTITYPDIPVYKDGEVVYTIPGDDFAAAQAEAETQTFTHGSSSGDEEVTAKFVLITDLLDGNLPDEGCGFIATASDSFTTTFTEDYLDTAYLYYDEAEDYYRTAVNGSAGNMWAKDVVGFTLGHDYENGVCIICGEEEPFSYADIPVYKDGEVVYTISGDDFEAAQAEAQTQTFTHGSSSGDEEVTAKFVLITDLLDGNLPDEGCGFIATASDNFTTTFTKDYLDTAYLYYDETNEYYRTAVNGSAGNMWAKDVVSFTLGHDYEDGVCIICGAEEPVITYPDVPVYKDGEVVYTITGDDFAAAQAEAPSQTFSYTSGGEAKEVTANFVLISDLLDGNLPDEGCGFIATGSDNFTTTFTEEYLSTAYLYYDKTEDCYRTAVNGSAGRYWVSDPASLTLGHIFEDGVCTICGALEPVITYPDIPVYKDGEEAYTISGDAFAAAQAEAPSQTFSYTSGGETKEVTANFVLITDLLDGHMPDEGCGFIATGSDNFTTTFTEEYLSTAYLYYDVAEGYYRTAVDGSAGRYWAKDMVSFTLGHDFVDGVCTICGKEEAIVDKGDLEKEIAEVEDEMSGLNKDNYTTESWEALEEALANAKAVAADPNATQDEVDAAVEALKTAVENLQPVKSDYTGFVKEGNKAYYMENGVITGKKQGIIKDADNALGDAGAWYYVIDSEVQYGFTGLSNFSNENGWWYIKSGKVDFTRNSVDQNNNGWWYVTGGKVQFGYTGVANYKNDNGWWYIKDGKVDFTRFSVDQNKNGWWYVTGGKVQFGYTGVANYKNANGWWYIKEGKVDFTRFSVDQNKNGWWYVTGGKVQFGYTGVANYSNQYGWWYINSGKVDFTYNGRASNNYGTWNIKGGKVDFS